MVNMSAYRRPVRRSLLQRDLLGGVPQAGLLLLLVLGAVFVYGLGLYFMTVPLIILYLVMRALTRRDQWLIDIVLDNVMQKDRYVP